MTVVGVLSDTHGHLHAGVKEVLAGVDHIVHAGDIGSPHILVELQAIAPVTAVRGNCDMGLWAFDLPVAAELHVDGVRILVSHIAGRRTDEVTARPGKAGVTSRGGGCEVLVSGHSHVASIEERDGVLHLNPGSAGPRRFGRARTVALLEIDGGEAPQAEAGGAPGAGTGEEREAGAGAPRALSGPEVRAMIVTAEAEERAKSPAG